MAASIAKLTEHITELSKAVAACSAAIIVDTTSCIKAKARFTQTNDHPQEKQTTAAPALEVLPPQGLEEPSKGKQSENDRAIGMLDRAVLEYDIPKDDAKREAQAQKTSGGRRPIHRATLHRRGRGE